MFKGNAARNPALSRREVAVVVDVAFAYFPWNVVPAEVVKLTRFEIDKLCHSSWRYHSILGGVVLANFGPRVCSFKSPSHMFEAHVDVHIRGRDRRMPEQFLERNDVGAMLNHVRRSSLLRLRFPTAHFDRVLLFTPSLTSSAKAMSAVVAIPIRAMPALAGHIVGAWSR